MGFHIWSDDFDLERERREDRRRDEPDAEELRRMDEALRLVEEERSASIGTRIAAQP